MIYRKIRPDIVHHFTPKPIVYGSFIANLLGISVIINSINGLGTLWTDNSWRKRLLLFLYKYTLNFKNTQNIFQNKDDMELLISKSIISPLSSMVIESCGINLQKYSPTKYTNNVKHNKLFTFLFLSRMLYDKGLEELKCPSLELYAEREDFTVILAGELDEGNPASVSEKWIKTISEDSPVRWIGFVDDTPKLIADCDVMILPSYREGFSQSLVEALAMGRPIITTDVPGCREVIDGNGFLVPPNNPEAIRVSLEKLIKDACLRSRMGKAGRLMVLKTFSEKMVIEKTLNVYKNLIDSLI